MLAVYLVVTATASASTLDRQYLFGDDPFEGGTAGSASFFSYNSHPVSIFATNDLTPTNSPTYADASARPGAAAGSLDMKFDGTSQYAIVPWVTGTSGSLGSPARADDNYGATPSPTYAGITTRLMEGWVKPTNSASVARQDVVFDSSQFGIFIDATNKWGWAYTGNTGSNDRAVIDTPLATVAYDQWTHVMHRTIGNGTGFFYVNGVVIGAQASNYTTGPSTTAGTPAGVHLNLTFGVNYNPAAATPNFFKGEIDDFNFYVSGNTTPLPPATPGGTNGQDYGAVDLRVENDYIKQALAGKNVGDVNLDGSLNQTDINLFVANYGTQKRVNNIVVADLDTRKAGDLDIDGDIDFDDALILRAGLHAPGAASGLDLSGLAGLGASVPEPGALLLAVFGLTAVASQRRRRK